MASYQIEHVNFRYPGSEELRLKDVSLSIEEGEFVLLCGPSGSGKTTLLRQLKREAAPEGRLEGSIRYDGEPLDSLPPRRSAEEIGMVFQDPDSQIVMSTVWQELAFALENLGYPAAAIQRRLGELVPFFGMEGWLHREVHELSGGQKQLLNLASVMSLRPKTLLLDEPTAQLDPVAAREFIGLLSRLNEELGLTIVISEHRFEDLFPLASRVVLLRDGRIACNATPREAALRIGGEGSMEALRFLPSIARMFAQTEANGKSVMAFEPEGMNPQSTFAALSSPARNSPAADVPQASYAEQEGTRFSGEDAPTAKGRAASVPLTVREGKAWLRGSQDRLATQLAFAGTAAASGLSGTASAAAGNVASSVAGTAAASGISGTASAAAGNVASSVAGTAAASGSSGTAGTAAGSSKSNAPSSPDAPALLECRELVFAYGKDEALVLNRLSLEVEQGQWMALFGSNGAGKSTLLQCIAGALEPQRGAISLGGEKLGRRKLQGGSEARSRIGYVAQNPLLYFTRDTVGSQLEDRLRRLGLERSASPLAELEELLELGGLQDRHPYDISGGQQQKLALLLVLLGQPELLLLDEPTKGLDPESKHRLAGLLENIRSKGTTLLMVSHDVEFAAAYTDRCGLLFDGQMAGLQSTRDFMKDNYYYTTAVRRAAGELLPELLTLKDLGYD
ncbi:ATP-binding cassette domain-containing protein [Paenibacillus pasadenensis]|uniref:ATP-binding cassette domain-containing protein n=1 Tax=Paenibacillus pasadenensis TaxID=217090 RepID=UPI00203E84B9|nr:ATP-binding cassette domain-containing protein [Paenibacillus pasadenensis]MCM3750252.1 ATP-binding cassette domain-containing protein [Paenibacillus pasadenensis]